MLWGGNLLDTLFCLREVPEQYPHSNRIRHTSTRQLDNIMAHANGLGCQETATPDNGLLDGQMHREGVLWFRCGSSTQFCLGELSLHTGYSTAWG